MNEKVKYRLVGVSIIVALMALFAPFVLLHSDDNSYSHVTSEFDPPAPPHKPVVKQVVAQGAEAISTQIQNP